jgi:hypothetical protein
MVYLSGNSSQYGILSIHSSDVGRVLPRLNLVIKYVFDAIKMFFSSKKCHIKTKKNQIISKIFSCIIVQKSLVRYGSYIIKVCSYFFTGQNLFIDYPDSFKHNITYIQSIINHWRRVFQNCRKAPVAMQITFPSYKKVSVAMQTSFTSCKKVFVAMQTSFTSCKKSSVAMQTPFISCKMVPVAMRTSFSSSKKVLVAMRSSFLSCKKVLVVMRTSFCKFGIGINMRHLYNSMTFIMLGNREINLLHYIIKK